MRKAIFTLLFLLGLCGISSAQTTHFYQTFYRDTKEVVDQSRIQFDRSHPDKIIAHFDKGLPGYRQKEKHVFDPDFATLEWSVKNEETKTDYTGVRENNKILIEGRFNGEDIKKKLKIDSKPFYAFPKFQLTSFLLSDQKKHVFWALRNDNLTVFKMVAQKDGQETIEINGMPTLTNKISWTTSNPLLKNFFKRTYYLRDDGLFLRQDYADGRIRELKREE